MKKIISVFLCAVTVALLCALVGSAGNVSDDPADSYTVQRAEYEDDGIDLWFDHSFRKTFTGDTVSTGMDTYSVYMAKNEIESAQFVLYSDTDKTKMTASITDFTDGKGNSISAEIYYQMYVTVEDLTVDNIIGGAEENGIIREGEIPDPVAPLSKVKNFKLNGGKSQAFLIRLTSKEDTKSGWYSAQLDVRDSQGKQVKTATVYAYVWDFTIPEETTFQSSMYIEENIDYGGGYKYFYDYLLENRLVGMDMPGEVSPDNPYLLNPRVNAARITANGGGNNKQYIDGTYNAGHYEGIYQKFRSSPLWDEIKDKLYFYTADEPVMSTTNMPCTGWDMDMTKALGDAVRAAWPGAQIVVPLHNNTPYPDNFYTAPLETYEDWQKKDTVERLIETDSVTIWCPLTRAFTPYRLLSKYSSGVVTINSAQSGSYYANGFDGGLTKVYYDWDSLFGEMTDRTMSQIAIKNAQGDSTYKMWDYGCGDNQGYTYCNHLIENTGLQSKLLFWQSYQNDVTGYLYYGTNNWTNNYTKEADTTVTGSKTTCKWFVNKREMEGYPVIYGNGVLFYGAKAGRVAGVNYIGSLRVEILRDGIEEYEMLTMLAEYKGRDHSKDIVSRVSSNVCEYLSLSNFSTAGWDSSMDEYDIMAEVRKQLGNELEEVSAESACEHKWDDGTVLKEAECKVMGSIKYTCTVCGAERTEVIPTLHAVGECFEKTSGTAADCNTDGNEIYTCTICGYRKAVTTPSHHTNPEMLTYEMKNETLHLTKCKECGLTVDTKKHVMITDRKAETCTEDGYERVVCRDCEYVESKTDKPKTEHDFANGVCTVCGEKEKTEPAKLLGDLDGDGKLSAKDSNLLSKIISGLATEDALADMNEDGKITSSDSTVLVSVLSGAE